MKSSNNEIETTQQLLMALDHSSRTYRIRTSELDWTVLQAGDGPRTMVFLPGALGSVEVFARQVLEFFPSWRVFVLGYPGERNPGRMTESFIRVLETLDATRACLIGSSLGAYWLQVFTSAHPELAETLVLGNTFIDAEPLQTNCLFSREFLEMSSPQAVKNAWLGFVESLPPSMQRSLLLELAGNRQGADELSGRLKTVAFAGRGPVSKVDAARLTVLCCEDDPITSGDMGAALRGAYPDAKHVLLRSGGHYPHVNNWAAYNACVAHACAFVHLESGK